MSGGDRMQVHEVHRQRQQPCLGPIRGGTLLDDRLHHAARIQIPQVTGRVHAASGADPAAIDAVGAVAGRRGGRGLTHG
jgi:hypothetical protein